MRIHRSAPAGRAALGLGAVAIATPLFALSTSSNNNFVLVQDSGLVVIPVLGVMAVIGALAASRPVVLLAGVGLALAAGIQLLQHGRDTNWLGGNGSTFSILMALGVGLLVVSLTSDPPSQDGKNDR